MTGPAAPHRALYSLHDVTPAKEALCFQALDHLRALGVHKVALLVVPDFHGRADLREFPAFCAALKQRLLPGDEVLLHGYWHLADTQPSDAFGALKAAALTAGEGEFQALTYAEARTRIDHGLQVLDDALGLRPTGFVAPAWLQNPDVRQAVADAGLGFCEDQLRIWPTSRAPILSPAISFASRTPTRLWGSIAASYVTGRALPRLPVARLAIHPNDYRSSHLRSAITRVISDWQTRTIPSRYDEVFA